MGNWYGVELLYSDLNLHQANKKSPSDVNIYIEKCICILEFKDINLESKLTILYTFFSCNDSEKKFLKKDVVTGHFLWNVIQFLEYFFFFVYIDLVYCDRFLDHSVFFPLGVIVNNFIFLSTLILRKKSIIESKFIWCK